MTILLQGRLKFRLRLDIGIDINEGDVAAAFSKVREWLTRPGGKD